MRREGGLTVKLLELMVVIFELISMICISEINELFDELAVLQSTSHFLFRY